MLFNFIYLYIYSVYTERVIKTLEHSVRVQYIWVIFPSYPKNTVCDRNLIFICLDVHTLSEGNSVLITIIESDMYYIQRQFDVMILQTNDYLTQCLFQFRFIRDRRYWNSFQELHHSVKRHFWKWHYKTQINHTIDPFSFIHSEIKLHELIEA